MTDTPVREPFDVEYARSHVGPATGRGFIEFLLEKACDEIERAHNEILSLVNSAKSIVAVERERDAAQAQAQAEVEEKNRERHDLCATIDTLKGVSERQTQAYVACARERNAALARLALAEQAINATRMFKDTWLENGDALWAHEALVVARKEVFDALAAYDAAKGSK